MVKKEKKKKEENFVQKATLARAVHRWGWCSWALEMTLLWPPPAPPCEHVFGCSVVGAGRAQHPDGCRTMPGEQPCSPVLLGDRRSLPPAPSFWGCRVSTPLWGLGTKLHPLQKGYTRQRDEDEEAASRGSSCPRGGFQPLEARCSEALLSLLWKLLRWV